MKKFLIFFIIWIGSNLAVPFWVVGHIHLSLNIYQDIYEIIASCGMNLLVLLAFWLEWKKHKKENKIDNIPSNLEYYQEYTSWNNFINQK